ncbi:MAG: hypothetical protein ACRCTA_00790 [Bacilli bacterium]
MKAKTHPVYQDYEIKPYIDENRDLEDWYENPDKYPYHIVSKKDLLPTSENLLPGDIIILWRINFNNFTTDAIIPNYFEYRYGINFDDHLKQLISDDYVIKLNALQSLSVINVGVLKKILQTNQIKPVGNKQALITQITSQLSEKQIQDLFTTRLYQLTPQGMTCLNNNQAIIKKHGLK